MYITPAHLDVFTELFNLPRWPRGKEFACQCRRCGFNPWVGKIPWRRKWQPTLVFLSEKSHGQRNLVGYSLWDCKKVGQNLETKPQQQYILSSTVSITSPGDFSTMWITLQFLVSQFLVHLLTSITICHGHTLDLVVLTHLILL